MAGTIAPDPLLQTEIVSQRITQELFPHSHDEFQQIERKIDEVNDRLEKLDNKIEELRRFYPRIVVVEEIPKDEAKHKVEEYFKENKEADIEELMINLKIPVEILVDIIDELKEEGKIASEGE